MNTDNFEDRIKETFEGYRPDTDNDAIWENIEPHLKKKKKRRGIIFFFWGLGLGLLLLFLYRTTCGPESPGTSVPSAASPEMPESRNAHPAPEENRTSPPDNGRSGISANRPAPENKISKAASDLKAATPKGSRSHSTGTAVVATEPLPALAPNLEPETAVAPTGIEPDANGKTATRARWSPAPFLTMPETGPLASQHARPPVMNKFAGREDENFHPDDSQKRKKQKRSPLPLEHNLTVQTGPAFAARRLTARKDAIVPSGYLDGRKRTEQPLESFTAGIFYSAITQNGLLIRAGLDYRQANERFHLAYTEKKTQQINGILTQTVDDSGNILNQTSGPKTVTVTTEYSYKDFNRYRYVNLPLGLGYRHRGEKNRWELAGGIDINLFFRTGGTILNRYLEPNPLSFGFFYYDEVFRRNTGLGAWTSCAYSRKLKDRLWWQVSANFQAPFKPVTRPDYELIQRYFHFGLTGGVVFLIEN